MSLTGETKISARSFVSVPIAQGWAALSVLLNHLERQPGALALPLELREMGLPWDAAVSLPVEARISGGRGRYESELTIQSARARNLFPSFHGLITMFPEREGSSLRLDGWYSTPFSAFGKPVETEISTSDAPPSLQRFLDRIARDVAALVRSDQTPYRRPISPLAENRSEF